MPDFSMLVDEFEPTIEANEASKNEQTPSVPFHSSKDNSLEIQMSELDNFKTQTSKPVVADLSFDDSLSQLTTPLQSTGLPNCDSTNVNTVSQSSTVPTMVFLDQRLNTLPTATMQTTNQASNNHHPTHH